MNFSNSINTSLNQLTQGTVYKKTVGFYLVHTGDRRVNCGISPRLRKEMQGFASGPKGKDRGKRDNKSGVQKDSIAVGDVVHFVEEQDGSGTIVEILPRQNQLSRQTAVPMPGAHAFEQVIAANVDQIVPVFAAANPPPKWNMLDRYLVTAESRGLPVLICISKLDLVQNGGGSLDDAIAEAAETYRNIGYPVVLVSAVTGEGLGDLRQAFKERTSVLVGKSGVGKSSLLNALEPGLGLRVNAVNQITGKGRHTTTHMEMFPLEFGGAIVDTPGTREFGLWDIDGEDMAYFFPEMRPYIGQCRFGLDCQHDEEPGCAIRKAVTSGKIHPRRYQSFIRLKESS
jgi:ribosome biogenesis GTPase / thiamine phosphate phosphatase